MGTRDLLFIGLILGGAAGLAASLYPPRLDAHPAPRAPDGPGLAETVRRVDAAFRDQWSEEGVRPAPLADESTLLRRLALSLTGSIPSLEEIRQLETLPREQRVVSYRESLLADRRFADYFAERFARSYVGTENGPFILFRRRRFVTWLSDQITRQTPYDRIVRQLVNSNGIWTEKPAVNFVSVTYDPERKYVDAERVAGRVARAFLGVRIDCAQCHDHPFANWKREDFQGLAAFYSHVTSGLTGIYQEPKPYETTDRKTGKPRAFSPRVPFQAELLPTDPKLPPRARLAAWVTHPSNKNFGRATVNRVWALMFGRALVEPVDDLSSVDELPAPLTILADDFVAHGYDLRRLVRAIATTEAFRIDSALPEGRPEPSEKSWAVFPMTRLRPEQVAGALLQAVTLTTIDAESNIVVRLSRVIGESQFIKRYGDSGEDEFDTRGGTIPQRLLMMNGELVKDRAKPSVFNAASRIGYFAHDDETAVQTLYVTVLTRQPTAPELRHFTAKLGGVKGNERGQRMADILWTLLNSSEFSWNH